MIEGIAKKKPQKDVYHFANVLEVLFQKWFPIGAEPQEKKKHKEHPQEDRKRKETLREKFIKNKRPLNLTHIFLETKNNQRPI